MRTARVWFAFVALWNVLSWSAEDQRDALGDPLPQGAIARLGDERLRPAFGPIDFSDDGRTVLCFPSVIDVATGQARPWRDEMPFEEQSLPEYSAAAWSRDRRWIALRPERIGGPDRLEIWDRQRGQLAESLPSIAVSELHFTNDARWLLARSDTQVRVWEFVPGRSQLLLGVDGLGTLSPDGRWLATWETSELIVRRLDAREIAWRQPLRTDVTALAFAPDGRQLAVGDKGGRVRVFESASGRTNAEISLAHETAETKERKPSVTVVGMSADGKLLAAGQAESLQVWNTETQRFLRTIAVHGTPVRLAFARQGTQLAWRSHDHDFLRIQDAVTGAEPVVAGPSFDRPMEFSADGRWLVTFDHTRKQIHVWDAQSGARVESHAADCVDLGLSADAAHVIVSQPDRVTVIRRRDGVRFDFPSPAGTYGRMTLSPDRKWVVCPRLTIGPQNNVRLQGAVDVLDWEARQVRKTLDIASSQPTFSPDGKKLALVEITVVPGRPPASQTIVFDTTTWQELLRAPGSSRLAFSPDGSRLAFPHEQQMRIVDIATGKPQATWPCDRSTDTLQFIEHDGREHLFLGETLLDVKTGAVRDLPFLYSYERHPAERWVFGRHREESAVVRCDLSNGRITGTWPVREHNRSRIVTSRDGRRLLTLAPRSRPLLWNTKVAPAPAAPPARETLASLGTALRSPDPDVAYQAIRDLIPRGDEAVAWIERHVRPADPPEVSTILAALTAADEQTRTLAEYELQAAGRASLRPLRDVAAREDVAKDAVAAARADELLRRLSSPLLRSAADLALHRSESVLERIATPAAQRVLAERRRTAPELAVPPPVEAPAGQAKLLATFRPSSMQHGNFGISLAALSPRGDFFATGGGLAIPWHLSGEGLDSRLVIKLWHPVSRQPRGELVGHWNVPTALAFSPRGDRLASADGDLIFLWDPKTARRLRHWSGHRSAVRALAFSEDGSRLLSAAADGTVRLWNTATGERVQDVADDQKHPIAASLSADGTIAAVLPSGPLDSLRSQLIERLPTAAPEAIVFELAGRKPGRRLPIASATCLAVHPRGRSLAVGTQHSEVVLFDLPEGEVRRRWKLPQHACLQVSWADDDTLCAHMTTAIVRLSPATDRPLLVTDSSPGVMTPDGKLVAQLAGGQVETREVGPVPKADDSERHVRPEPQFVFSPDGRRLYRGGGRTPLEVWDATTGVRLAQLPERLYPMVASPDERFVVAMQPSEFHRLIEVATGRTLMPALELRRHDWLSDSRPPTLSLPRSVALDRRGRELIARDAEGFARIELATGTVLARAEFADSGPHHGEFSPSGRWALCAFSQDAWQVADVRTGKLAWPKWLRDRNGSSLDARFLDDRTCTFATTDSLRIVDAADGRVRHTWSLAESTPACVTDGGTTLVEAFAGQFLFTSVEGSQRTASFFVESPVREVEASPDGKRLLTRSADGSVRLWHVAPLARPGVVRTLHGRRHRPPEFATPLMQAAYYGRLDFVRALIATGSDLHRGNDSSGRPLHLAALGGHLAVCDELLQHGADARSPRDDDGATPLHCAAEGGSADVVRLLLKHGAAHDAKDRAGHTPLHRASQFGQADVVAALLAAGAAVEAPNDDGATPLLLAAREGHFAASSRLIAAGATADGPPFQGRSWLDWAAEHGSEALLRLLIEKGATLTADLGRPALTAEQRRDPAVVARRLLARSEAARRLRPAVTDGELDKVRAYLDVLPDAVWRRSDGTTLLGEAVTAGRREMVELLLERRADPWMRHDITFYRNDDPADAVELEPGTALHAAVQRQDVALMKRLTEAGATFEQGRPGLGGAALAWQLARQDDVRKAIDQFVLQQARAEWPAYLAPAAGAGRDEVVAALLAARVNPNHAAPGSTPLDSAVLGKHWRVVRRLLDAGAKADARDPVDIAPPEDHPDAPAIRAHLRNRAQPPVPQKPEPQPRVDLTGGFRCYTALLLPAGTISVSADPAFLEIANVAGERWATVEIEEGGLAVWLRELPGQRREITVRDRRQGPPTTRTFATWDEVRATVPAAYEAFARLEVRLEAELLEGEMTYRGSMVFANDLPWPAAGVAVRDVPGGCQVESVVPNGPADRAGLQAGDFIESVGRFRCPNEAGLANLIARHEIGERVPFGIRRGAVQRTVEVVLAKQ